MADSNEEAELLACLRALYAAAAYSDGARDDFWDKVTTNIECLLLLAERGAKRRKPNPEGHRAAGLKRAASLTPERRSEIARVAAQARWGQKTKEKE